MVLADSFYYQPVQIDTINTRVNADIFAKEGDANSRGMVVQITENGMIKDTTGITLRLQWSHISVAVSGFTDFEVVDATKGLYKVKYPTSMLHRGRVEAFIRITDNGILSGTRNLMITVERMVGSDKTIEASDDFSALQTALIQLDAWNVTIGKKVDTWEADMKATKQLYIDTLAATEAGYSQELVSLKSELADIATPQVVWNRADTNRRPLISFTSDDGSGADITVMGPILKRYNVPATVSLITDTITNIDEYKNLQDNYGWEIASHSTDSTLLSTIPIADCEEKLKESKRILESYGFNIKSFVYPTGSANANVKRVAKKYYEAAYNYDDRVNTENFIDSFSIHRVPLGSFYTNPSHNTLEYYKECVDKAYDNNGWCVFCLHPYKEDFDEIQQGYLEQLIQYIISKNIEMVTLSDGYRIFGNVVEAGSSYNTVTEDEYQRFVVSNDGRTNLPIFYEGEGAVRSTSVPKDFRDRMVTIAYISRYADATFPDSASGITITIRANDITNQMWLPSNSNRVYKRVATNTTSFGSFALITPIVGKTGINNYSASQSNAALANEQITVTEITTGSSLGFPTNTGTLISKRFPKFTSQTYLPSDDDAAIYRRHWDANTGTWTPFVNPLINKNGNMYSTVFSMSHTWTSLPIPFVSLLYIDKFVSMQGAGPTLSKQIWSISEISTIESEPTEIGRIPSNGQKLYVYKSDTKLYLRYASVGNNYPAAISLIYM